LNRDAFEGQAPRYFPFAQAFFKACFQACTQYELICAIPGYATAALNDKQKKFFFKYSVRRNKETKQKRKCFNGIMQVSSMLFDQRKLGDIARQMMQVLDQQQVTSYEDLEQMVGQRFIINDCERVSVLRRPSNAGTQTVVVEYSINGGGVPLDIAINKVLDYAHLTVKCTEIRAGYSPFGQDSFGNIQQRKTVFTPDLSDVLNEVKKLCR